MSDEKPRPGGSDQSDEFERLMRARMAEMGAVIDMFMGKASEFQEETRKNVEKAVKDMEGQRATFEKHAESLRSAGEDALKQTMSEAEKLWDRFEDSAEEAAKKFNAERETYKARAEAGMKSWKETADWFADQAETAAKRSREEFEKIAKGIGGDTGPDASATMRQATDAYLAAWKAMADGFEAAWQDLEKASKTAADAFKDAQKEQGKK